MKTKLKKIKIKDLFRTIFPSKEEKFSYLGYTWWSKKSKNFKLIQNFLKECDRVARPKWCPKFFLRLLHLYGNNNSVFYVRNYKISNLHKKLTKNIFITDMKWKYNTFRIHGYFTPELYDKMKELIEKIEYNTSIKKDLN